MNEGPWLVDGQPVWAKMDEVVSLKRSGEHDKLVLLLNRMMDATEAEDRRDGHGVAPAPYKELAIAARKLGELELEVATLERFQRQNHAPGALPGQLINRLNKLRQSIRDGKKPRGFGSALGATETIPITSEDTMRRFIDTVEGGALPREAMKMLGISQNEVNAWLRQSAQHENKSWFERRYSAAKAVCYASRFGDGTIDVAVRATLQADGTWKIGVHSS